MQTSYKKYLLRLGSILYEDYYKRISFSFELVGVHLNEWMQLRDKFQTGHTGYSLI